MPELVLYGIRLLAKQILGTVLDVEMDQSGSRAVAELAVVRREIKLEIFCSREQLQCWAALWSSDRASSSPTPGDSRCPLSLAGTNLWTRQLS